MTREPCDSEIALADQLGQIPSVTEILDATGLGPDYNGVPAAWLERKRLLGTALHAAVHYDAEGTLDAASVDPEIADSLNLCRQFFADSGLRIVHSEIELIHPQWHFKGHPDCVCRRPDGGHAILDLKYVASVDRAAVALQLAGYRLLVTEVLKLPVKACAALQIHDGHYSYVDLTQEVIASAQTFLAAVVVFQARHRRR